MSTTMPTFAINLNIMKQKNKIELTSVRPVRCITRIQPQCPAANVVYIWPILKEHVNAVEGLAKHPGVIILTPEIPRSTMHNNHQI